mgnify:CR=1 FL=1
MSVNNKIMDALGEQGYTGSINERIQANLFDLYGEANINVGLSKAGGFKRYVSDLTGVEYVAQLDGATQSWVLSGPITAPANTDFKASFYISGVNDGYEGLFSSPDPQSWLRLLPSNNSVNLQGQLGAGYYQAVPFSELNIRDGVTRKLSIERVAGRMRFVIDDTFVFNSSTLSSEFTVQTLAKFGSDLFGGTIYGFEFELNGVLTNQIPLTNKAQGATQLATVGSVNATMIGYDPSVWIIK